MDVNIDGRDMLMPIRRGERQASHVECIGDPGRSAVVKASPAAFVALQPYLRLPTLRLLDENNLNDGQWLFCTVSGSDLAHRSTLSL